MSAQVVVSTLTSDLGTTLRFTAAVFDASKRPVHKKKSQRQRKWTTKQKRKQQPKKRLSREPQQPHLQQLQVVKVQQLVEYETVLAMF